jgi:hypothetical protein
MSQFATNPNISFTIKLYNQQGQFVRKLPPLILSVTDYSTMAEMELEQYGVEFKVNDIFATILPPTTTIAALKQELQILFTKINLSSTDVQPITSFTIACEKPGAVRNGVTLSEDDFNLLKLNVHFFAVVNIVHTTGVPNIGIHDLNTWIANNSTTPVPDVPTNH